MMMIDDDDVVVVVVVGDVVVVLLSDFLRSFIVRDNNCQTEELSDVDYYFYIINYYFVLSRDN